MVVGHDLVVAAGRGEVLRCALVVTCQLESFPQSCMSQNLTRSSHFEFIIERLVVEENPWVLVFVIPVIL